MGRNFATSKQQNKVKRLRSSEEQSCVMEQTLAEFEAESALNSVPLKEEQPLSLLVFVRERLGQEQSPLAQALLDAAERKLTKG